MRIANFGKHCRFTASRHRRSSEKFAGDWFSKANYNGGITPGKAAGFIGYAMAKLGAELKKGAEGDES